MTVQVTQPAWAHDPLGDAWWAFHCEHPEVYVALRRLAREWRSRRRDRCGIGMLWERLRWETALGDPDADYKLNNNHRSLYARALMDWEPDLVDLFELRKRP